MKKPIQTLAILPLSLLLNLGSGGNHSNPVIPAINEHVIAQKEMPLNDRYPVKSVSDIFKDNILLNLAYMNGKVTKASDIKWDEITKPFKFEFRLEPNKTFAFHSGEGIVPAGSLSENSEVVVPKPNFET